MDFDCYWKWFELDFNEMNEFLRLKLIKDVLNFWCLKVPLFWCKSRASNSHENLMIKSCFELKFSMEGIWEKFKSLANIQNYLVLMAWIEMIMNSNKY